MFFIISCHLLDPGAGGSGETVSSEAPEASGRSSASRKSGFSYKSLESGECCESGEACASCESDEPLESGKFCLSDVITLHFFTI